MAEGYYYVNGRKLYASGFQDEWFEKYFGSPDNVKVIFAFGSFDCGDGYRYKKKCKNSSVYSIEACPERFKIIENFAKENDINVFNFAVSDKDGEIIDFYQCLDPNEGDLKYGPAGSILCRTWRHTTNWSHLSYPEPIKVKSITLDTLCKEQGVSSIDFLHIDVEGAEQKVLNGLTFTNPKLIYLETHLGEGWYSGGYVIEDMHEYLLNRGYKLEFDGGTDRLYVLK